MARRAKSQAGIGLDSLLDTMTNVVGILVIMLIVTQLGVGEAVSRIGSSESVQPEVFEKVLQDRNDLQDRFNMLANEVGDMRQAGKIDPEQTVKNYKQEIKEENTNIERLLAARAPDPSVEIDRKNLEEERKVEIDNLIAKLEKEEEDLSKKVADQIAAAQSKIEELLARLNAIPEREVPKPDIIVLPNPRAAPAKAKPTRFICREGRLTLIDEEQIQKDAQLRTAYVLDKKMHIRDPKKQVVDGATLSKEFNERPVVVGDFRVEMIVQGRYPKLVLRRKTSAGETPGQIEAPQSDYQRRIRMLKSMNMSGGVKHYLQFLVWSDSFETYISARQIAQKNEMLAGWQPQTMTGEYMISLGAPLLCGPAPPPKPSGGNTGGGGTKPGPQQPTRPRPNDVID